MEQAINHHNSEGAAAVLLTALSWAGYALDTNGLDAAVVVPLLHLAQFTATVVSVIIGLRFLYKSYKNGK